MALVVKDRVQETSTTTGTGTFTLAGAVTGFQSFSVIGNANTTYYAIVGGTEWEVGLGTYTSSGTLLSRDTILESSNGGTAVNFSAGTKNVFVTYPAEKGIYLDASNNAIALGVPASATLTNATGLPLSTGVTGTLPIANGGTGTTSTTFANLTTNVTGTLPVANGGTGITSLGAGVATFLGTPSSANLASAVTNETGSGSLVFATSPTLVTPILGTPSSGTLTSCTGLPLTTGVTGTLPIANGGTGETSRQNAMDALAGAVTSGQYLRGNGTDVVMSAIQAADVPTLNQNTTGSAATVTGNATGSTFGFNSGYGSVVTAYGCRAWVNFNGTGTVAIRSSGNVTSITDNGTGDYTVNFTTAITDVNYAVTGMSRSTSSSGYLIYGHATSGNATGSVRISTSSTTAFGDSETVSVSIFR